MPVPEVTTPRSIVESCAATILETIRRRTPRVRATGCGRTHTPRFAIAAYAEAICIGVTAIPWPIGTFPIVEPDQYEGRIPALSPGKSTPVGRPKPKRAIH